MKNNYKNFQIEKDNDDILWLYLDKQDSDVNTLDETIFVELDKIFEHIEKNSNEYRGLVLASKKSTGFVHGANIKKFSQLKDMEDIYKLVRRGQILTDRLENLPIASVAMIEGFCLGGGLEFSLACTYRVAVDEDKNTIGLPEVLLGFHPGWGGSVRLPKLIGALKAFDLILSGRNVSAKTAFKMGFIDAAVPKRQLKNAARTLILKRATARKASFLESLTNSSLIRPILASIMEKKLKAKISKDQYPGPYAVLNNWKKHGVSHDKAMLGEAHSMKIVTSTDTAKNLVRVYFLQNQMKEQAKLEGFKAYHVHVIGAGIMGGDIAAWCALKGLKVTLQDSSKEAIAATFKRSYKLFKKKLKKPRLVQNAMDRLQADIDGYGIKHADVIIEAIFEDLKVKQELFQRIEKRAKKDAVLATNTSTIPLDELNTVLKKPERLIGIHFFNPVARMQLVEVIHGKNTATKEYEKGLAFVKQISKLPILVKSSPGFLVNRILTPYLNECMQLMEEGVPKAVIDKEAEKFGMPIGPVELADTVGLDVCLLAAKSMSEHFGGQIPKGFEDRVERGDLGRKTGKGFYSYKNGKAKKSIPPNYKAPKDLQDRLILSIVNESMACLGEELVTDRDLLDGAMIFGTGFAPFRGGPINYAKHRGLDDIKQTLQKFSEIYGERFTPDPSFNNTKEIAEPTLKKELSDEK